MPSLNELHNRLDRYMTNDRINGVFAIGNLEEYFDEKKVKMAQDDIKKSKGLVIVYGIGASRVVKGNILIYNNILSLTARKEIKWSKALV